MKRAQFDQKYDWLDGSRERHEGVTVPRIWIAILVSILVHLATLLTVKPELFFPSPDDAKRGVQQGSLVVQLAQPTSPPASARPPTPPTPQAQSAPAIKAQPPPPPARKPSPPKTVPRPQPTPPVIALNRPTSPAVPASPPTPPPVPAPTPARPPAPAGNDLASYIEARRQVRQPTAASPPAPPPSPSSGPPEEDANERAQRLAAANLGTNRAPTYGSEQLSGGGIFQIKRLGYSDAEFVFFGWNKDIRRNTTQRIEVQRGDNPDIRIAVVRRMIAIIREYEQEDFLWESRRLGRNLTLSARAKDNAELENFLMREFFYDVRSP